MNRCTGEKRELVFCVPLIDEINTDTGHIRSLARFVVKTGVTEVHLLPYHRFGESKYSKLGREYICTGFTPDVKTVEKIKNMLESFNLHVFIGG